MKGNFINQEALMDHEDFELCSPSLDELNKLQVQNRQLYKKIHDLELRNTYLESALHTVEVLSDPIDLCRSELVLAAEEVLAIAAAWNTPAKPGGKTALALERLAAAVDETKQLLEEEDEDLHS